MKKTLLTLLFILGSYAVQAQELVWNNNLKNSIEISNKTKKPLLLFFTGSDWCGWCIRLQTEVFKTPEFKKWANDNVVLVELDFPRRTVLAPEITEQNNQLQQFFAVQGYPTVWFVNATLNDGKVNIDKLGNTGYLAGGPKVWLETANGILKKK
ncbi:MAG: thioredoxin family protein [Flavobacterium sp.]|jgi:protein disulfide-isomerase|nr:thioredoxin family protein [Flavobacterium sp.]